MIKINLEKISREDLAHLEDKIPDYNLLQSWEYGEAKSSTSNWRVNRHFFSNNGNKIGYAQVFVKHIPYLNTGVAWVNRGPLVLTENYSPLYPNLLNALYEDYVQERNMYLLIAPAQDKKSTLAAQNIEKFQVTKTPGWVSARVNLAEPLDKVRGKLGQKWRNSLNKSERMKLECLSGIQPDLFSTFVTNHQTFVEHHRYTTAVTPILLKRLQNLLPNNRKMYVFLAIQEGSCIGSILVCRYGKTCEYLAGNSTAKGRANCSGQFLIWQAIRQMKKLGFHWFDLGGLDAEQTPSGILRFKRGVGGTPYELAPEIESHGGKLTSWSLGKFIQYYRKTF